GEALPTFTLEEIDRVSTAPAETTVWLIGGTSAVGSPVADSLDAAGYTVQRLGGTNRYDTSRLVAERIAQLAGPGFSGSAFMVNGRAFADGLAVGPVAYARAMPVLLTERDTLPAETAAAILGAGIDDISVVGGTNAVSTGVLAQLGSSASRVAAGGNRYQTASLFAQWAVGQSLATPSWTGIASGIGFPDALCAGAVIGARGGVLLLTSPAELDASASVFIAESRTDIARALVFGGPAAVSDAVRSRLYEVLNP
ncbi:MAG: cell wall-binding repeat-containing protein, partial [Actinomycetota bacterium]|nr:cell wall-binding repeat-containing protein [Actinomycetota bacterium]